MHQDDVSLAVRNDHYILQLAQSLFNKHGHDPSKHEYIRQKIRELGRLIVTLHNTTNIHNLEEAIQPRNFITLTNAVKDVAGFDGENNSYKSPSLALKIGHSLRKVSDLIQCRALMTDDQEGIRSVEMFQKLYEAKWSEFVSHSALSNLSEAKYNKASSLPLTRDIQKLHQFLDQEAESALKVLKGTSCATNYAKLSRLTLCQVILFNRRRAGEVSKMTVKNYQDRKTSKLSDVNFGLSEMEKKLSEHFARVELRGKRDRKVAVLLTPKMTTALSLLVSKRQECGVEDSNTYLFGIPRCQSHYRGQDCLRSYADLCGAENPAYLRSTNLRKHVATISQVMNLKDNELDQLADFLGHDIRVHREFYRLPESTIQVAKISKLLLAMEKGSLSNIQGKSLDQIDDEVDMSNASKEGVEADIFTTWQTEGEGGNIGAGSSVASSGNTAQRGRKTAYVKQPWSSLETKAVMKHFGQHIKKGKLATLTECEACKEAENPILEKRTLQNIRDFVRNRGISHKRLLLSVDR
ncbi:uncharacterized protein LOC125782687 [Astyanax mexicanus]|nr:uncharacterized protein LOC125782687 [Astyanax mexicanus]